MDKAEKGTTPRNLLRLCFWKAVPKKMIRFLRVFCTLPQLQDFSLVLSTSSTWFLHEKAPEGFPKGSEGVSSCTFETDGHSFRKDCSSFEKYLYYIYTYTFPQKNSTFSKECWVVCDAALAQQLRFSVDMYLAEACIYISILKGWLHCKSLWMPGFLPPNLPLFQEAACIFAECYLLCSKEIHLEGCCTRWRSARSLECRAFKMECQTFLKEQPLAKGWLYLLRWVLYLLIDRLHFVWIQLCLNVNVAFFLKKIKKTALILCTLR